MGTKTISDVLRLIADSFDHGSKNAILMHGFGKHIFEINEILQHLPKNGKMLDVGGGKGVNLLCIQKLLEMENNADVSLSLSLIDKFVSTTYTNQETEAIISRMEKSNIDVIDYDFWANKNLPYEPEIFDVVTIFDVIEHLPSNPLYILKDINRILKPDGVILMGVPNAVHLGHILQIILEKHPYIDFDAWIKDEYYSHIREYTMNECLRMLELSNFYNVKCEMSLEPWTTMATNSFYLKKHKFGSPIALGLHLLPIFGSIFPSKAASIYCTAQKFNLKK